MALCVTLFLLINSLNFCICLFFVNSKDFLYKFSWIFSTRWNSPGVIDSKILPFNCLMLFLSLSCITWLICICSCSNSLPVHCKIILLGSVLILLFSCRSFGRILLWFFFSISVFFHEHSEITGLQRKGEGISLTPHYHFHPLHRCLDISWTITAESSPLHIASSRTRTRNLWFPRASH